jgi:hypothetical protein
MASTEKLELICPRCGASLALDCGFAGSVCRCSSCGELLSVRGSGRQENQDKRPDRPVGGNGAKNGANRGTAGSPKSVRAGGKRSRRWLLVVLALAAIVLAGIGAWWAVSS